MLKIHTVKIIEELIERTTEEAEYCKMSGFAGFSQLLERVNLSFENALSYYKLILSSKGGSALEKRQLERLSELSSEVKTLPESL